MSVPTPSPVARYFGAQVRKHRIAANLNIAQLARITGIDSSHLSRIERGERNPTPDIARRLDEHAFPKLEGHFMELYEASRSWVPAAFRRWAEYEDQAMRLLVWEPGVINGLIQTRDYARSILLTLPGVTDDQVSARLADRMARQQRIVYRDDPPHIFFVIDELALYRRVGSAAIMAAQLQHLTEVASLSHVTMTVMPAIEHSANESGFIIADSAVYAESAASLGVHTDQTVTELLARFGSLQADSYGRSESLSTIKKVGAIWASGVSPLTQGPTAETA